MRIALIVEYDGADFSGSQFQLNARTVQGELEAAAATIFGKNVDRINLASRTDAGVHAFGQVAALDVDTSMPDEEMRRAMNGNLPADVCVKLVRRVPYDFDPRRDAIAREYSYTINDGPTHSPIYRRREYHVNRHLDVAAMAEAARNFIGVHDFASFAASTTHSVSTIRRVESATVTRTSTNRIAFDIRANAFVRQQIRRMVAALIAVGSGSRNEEWIVSLINRPRRDSASQNAPPHGLILMRVIYSPDLSLEINGNEDKQRSRNLG